MTAKTQPEDLSPIKKALYEIRTLRGKLQELSQAQNEPIAVVGVGLRFPGGASDAASYWKILADRSSTITEIPASRWPIDEYYDPDPDATGKMYTRHGSFLNDVAGFDAHMFGVSPREAVELDPQHRIALEVAWEALENAGSSAAQAAERVAGVFLALSNSDYTRMVFNGDVSQLDAYSCTGNNPSVAAGRISYTLGLTGPSIVVDTACSASLVAVHLACQSLRAQECHLALAGGVNLILTPDLHVNFSKARMLSADGHCKTFDAKADGYVRGEGCGIVVLKRLSDALNDRDNILALVRGSAVNQDGRSGGLTVPSGEAQQRVIRQALANAGVEPGEIGYIEAHGTGTSLGDPIEAHALAAVFGPGRAKENPLIVGSVKTNVGHLEASAGIAGLIKVALAFQNEELPANLHFEKMNPHIDWSGMPVEILTRSRPWPRANGRRVAGVSSFGFSGTNAHVILEEAPVPEPPKRESERPLHVLALSARSKAALQTLTERYANELAGTTADLGDICYTANSGRTHFDERAVYLGATREEITRALLLKPILSGTKNGDQEVVFLFPGQGTQYPGMGRELYLTEPAFRKTLDECAKVLNGELDTPLFELLWGKATERLKQTAYAQPAVFAVEYATAEMWRSWGIEPAAVLGHSVGEYVAACVAGVYTLADGLKLIVGRARLMQSVAGEGGMLAVLASEDRAKMAIAGLEGRLSIAAFNAPESMVIAGYEDALAQAEAHLRDAGVKTQRLTVSHAFHSPQMESIEVAFEQLARGVRSEAPRINLISSVTGLAAGPEELSDPAYWRRQIRQPVQFRKAMETLCELGHRVFLETGPGGTLVGLGQQSIPGRECAWITSLGKGRAEWPHVLESLGQLYVRGVEVDWAAFDRAYPRRRVPLPSYPFEHQSYWTQNKRSASPFGSDDENWQQIHDSALRQSSQGSLALNVALYPERWALLDQLTTAYIISTLASSGGFQQPNETHTVESLMERCGYKPSYSKLLERWLDRLVKRGKLRQDGGAFVAPEPLCGDSTKDLRSRAEKAFAGDRILLEWVVACGEDLVAILRGRMSALETLFPKGSFQRAEDIYERSPMSAYFSCIARAALEGFLRTRGSDLIRAIEIGAGTGSTSSFLLPILSGGNATYDFTDVSELFVQNAQRKFAKYPFVRYGRFDIERGGDAQGYSSGGFDVVVATNALHATRNIRSTIANVRSLLSPGGILILSEVTNYLSWFDITTGLIEGWQLFEDGLRGDHPLMESSVWTTCLTEGGFPRVMAFPEAGSPAEVLGQHVIVAGTSSAGGARRVVPPASMPAAQPAAERVAPALPEVDLAAWLETSPADRHERFVHLVRRQIADLLRFDSLDRVKSKSRLIDLGLDSLLAIELRDRLARSLSLKKPLSSTLVFDYPTPDVVASHLENELLGLGEDSNDEQAKDVAIATRASELAQLDDEDVRELLLKKLQSL
ncbi:MAG: beta-ketoacyl synthase N-terminal-like domain-containing protein [Candidatus Acidiferrales bacterium]